MDTFDLNHVTSWKEALVASFQQALTQVVPIIPKVVGMVVVLVVGYVLARMLDRLASELSQRIGLETAADRSGLAQSMKHVGINRSVPWIVGQLAFWLTLCVFASAAFHILGLDSVTTAMNTLVGYIPKLLVGSVIVIVGLLVAQFFRGVIATSADRVGISYAQTLADIGYYVLALMTVMAAFDQIGFQFGLLREMLLIGFAGLALGFGLAFGLGGREVMGGILAGYYTRQRLQAGDHVTVCGLEGIVREVGPVATIIETDEDGFVNRHTVPNTKMLNEAVR